MKADEGGRREGDAFFGSREGKFEATAAENFPSPSSLLPLHHPLFGSSTGGNNVWMVVVAWILREEGDRYKTFAAALLFNSLLPLVPREALYIYQTEAFQSDGDSLTR